MRKVIKVLLLALLIFAAVYGYLFFQQEREKGVLTLFGNVDVRQVDIGFRVNGRVIDMPFQEGDFVETGALMATLDKQPYLDQYAQAKSSLQSTQTSLDNAASIFRRRQELISDGSISKEDYENTEANKNVLEANLKQAKAALGVALTNLRDTQVYAPSDGTILTRIREPGSVVLQSEPVYTLSLISPVWIRAFVSEPFLGVVYPGMPAEIFTDSRKDFVYKGHVGFISPVAEFTPKTVETRELRTDLVYRLRIIADNPDWGLRQGMPVTVKLKLDAPVKN